jgi:hypothetical protein
MKATDRSDFIKSSNLLLIAVGLIIISSIITQILIPYESNRLIVIIVNILMIGSVGFIIRQGMNWTKYLVLPLLILYLIEGSYFLTNPESNLTLKFIFFAQLILVIWASVILFLKTRNKQLKIT